MIISVNMTAHTSRSGLHQQRKKKKRLACNVALSKYLPVKYHANREEKQLVGGLGDVTSSPHS